MEKLENKAKFMYVIDAKLFLEHFLTPKNGKSALSTDPGQTIFDHALCLFQTQYCFYNEQKQAIEPIPDNVSPEQLLNIIKDDKNLMSLYPFYNNGCVKKLKKVNHYFLECVNAANHYYNTIIEVRTQSLIDLKVTKDEEDFIIQDFSNAMDEKDNLNNCVEKAQTVFVYQKKPARERLKNFVSKHLHFKQNDEQMTK